MAQLFDKGIDTSGLHPKNIYQSGEIGRQAVTAKLNWYYKKD